MFRVIRSQSVFLLGVLYGALCILSCLAYPTIARADTPCNTYFQGGSLKNYFEPYENAEYVDGRLVIHFRLQHPYDGLPIGIRFYTFRNISETETCNSQFYGYSQIALTIGIRNWSVRFVSPTQYEIWNDEDNVPETCQFCSGPTPTDMDAVKEVAVQGFVNGGYTDQFLSTSFPTTPPPSIHAECCSSVLFIPGLQGSNLKIANNTVWPPTILSSDLPKLALDGDGKSVNEVTVDGIVDTFYGTPIYSGFSSFLDSLTHIDPEASTSTIKEWKSFAYDWRFGPTQIIEDGVDTTDGHVDPVEMVEQMASSSPTGKVTIIAHSMGGLVGKALIKKLVDENKQDLIDSFVMVGVPQLGTPQAVAGLLHGDNQAIPGGLFLPGIIANPSVVRTISQNMPGPYSLIPSPRYFDEVYNPPIVFDENAGFTDEWRAAWGLSLEEYNQFAEFLTGAGVPRTMPAVNDLRTPSVLDVPTLLEAKEFHDEFDNFEFPDSIRVVQVAGWGLPTLKTIKYQNVHFLPGYKTVLTIEGDRTVIYPSAKALDIAALYLNLYSLNKDQSSKIQHRDMMNNFEFQSLVFSVIKNHSLYVSNYLLSEKPEIESVDDQLLVTTYSPVHLGISDSFGNFTGIDSMQDFDSDFLNIKEEIPNSSFLSFGDSESVFIPKEGIYHADVSGYDTGPVTIDIQNFSHDLANTTATYTDIPFTKDAKASFVVDAKELTNTTLLLDTDGDGTINYYIAPDNGALTLEELLFNIKEYISTLDANDKIKKLLLKEVQKIEKTISKNKGDKASVVVMSLEKKLEKKWAKKYLSDSEIQDLIILINDIEKAL